MALLLGSTLTSLMLLYSGYWGLAIVRGFDIRSGSERQLRLERRTYLVSTVVAYAFGFQLLSFFLFLFTADLIHPLFPGAMCAAGVLNVNRFGYPALLLKFVNFLLAGMWLILNAADNRGYDYPLVRKKYLFLLAVIPLVLAEAAVQALFFLGLDPGVITSCCGALFSRERSGVPDWLGGAPPPMSLAGFYLGGAGCPGARPYYRERGGRGGSSGRPWPSTSSSRRSPPSRSFSPDCGWSCCEGRPGGKTKGGSGDEIEAATGRSMRERRDGMKNRIAIRGISMAAGLALLLWLHAPALAIYG